MRSDPIPRRKRTSRHQQSPNVSTVSPWMAFGVRSFIIKYWINASFPILFHTNAFTLQLPLHRKKKRYNCKTLYINTQKITHYAVKMISTAMVESFEACL